MSNTHFGFSTIDEAQKAAKVRGVFDSVAGNYDLMNDVMSLGLHRLWKLRTFQAARLEPGMKVLDIAGGTGDMAEGFAKRVGPSGEVVHTDINEAMLNTGRVRLINAGFHLPTHVCDAEALPFASGRFDRVCVAFGLRNMTRKHLALTEMARVLKPGGKLLVLEFSHVAQPLAKPYDWYSFNVLPKLGKWLAKDEASYRYLAESIRMHPNQAELKALMQQNGMAHVDIHNMTGAVVALHVGIKA